MKKVYLDYNATAPMEDGVVDAMLPFFASANPSSIHWSGRQAKHAVEKAREVLARVLSFSDPEELFFTSSGTESINTALKGIFFLQKEQGKILQLITTKVEHEATLEAAFFLKRQGANVHLLDVNAEGQLDLLVLEELLKTLSSEPKNFLLLSAMAANNETGILFPYQKLANLCQKYHAIFHLDAVQAIGKISDFSIQETKADLLSASAHKIGGPKGVGFLYVKKGLKLEPLLHGGAQERKRRAGTLNVSGIVGFAKAVELLNPNQYRYVAGLRDFLEDEIVAKISGLHIQGKNQNRVTNTSHIIFDGVRGEGLLLSLDMAGFAVSSGSACNSGSINPSHVLLAMGWDRSAAASAIRVSLSHRTNIDEIRAFVTAPYEAVERIRQIKTDSARLLAKSL